MQALELTHRSVQRQYNQSKNLGVRAQLLVCT